MSGAEVFWLVAATAASTVVTVAAQQAQARDQRTMNEYAAKQNEQKAGQDRAIAQRRAMEERRQARLAISRAQAVTGGGAGDEGVLALTVNIAGEGEYNALTALYEGEQSALGRQGQADGLRMEGQMAQRAANYKSAATIVSSASSMYGKYASGGFGGGGGTRYKVPTYEGAEY